jgi:hypothetical protein
MIYRTFVFLIATFLMKNVAICQSVEVYIGDKRAGVDLMWFKNFENKNGENTPFIFFSRNRASTDYQNAPTMFGSLNAVSYNLKNGFGVVAVASLLNEGFVPKAGGQFYKNKGNFTFFGWFVADLEKEGGLDLFGLFRYQPTINKAWKGFGQLELFSVFYPTADLWNVTQRLRLGARYHDWAGGLMMDFNQLGKDNFIKTSNIGGFLKCDF